MEDLGPDMEEDIKTQNQSSRDANANSNNSPEEDDGPWILDLIDLSGLEKWPEQLQIEAKEMLKRNAKVFSKTDMDMGRTNLVKHHIKQILSLLRKHTGEFLHKCMTRSKPIFKKC